MAGLFRIHGLARRFFAEAYQSAISRSDWRAAAHVLTLESFSHAGEGRFREAEHAALRAAETCAMTNDPWTRENVETTLSHIEYFMGRFEAARSRAEHVARLAVERQHEQHEVWGLYLQARSHIAQGRHDLARTLLEQAVDRLAGRSEVISEIACKGMLADACSADGDMIHAEPLAMEVVHLVRGRLPAAYPSLVGYTAASNALCRLRGLRPSPELAAASASLAVALWRFASLFPVALPAAHLHTAHLLSGRGLRRVAQHLFLRGAAHAERRSMPYERALLLRGAGEVATSKTRRDKCKTEAQEILRRLGAQAPVGI
jgi:hypothetical protein